MTRYDRTGILVITYGTGWAMDCISLISRRIDFSNAQYEESKKSKSLNEYVSLDTYKVLIVTKMGNRSLPLADEPPTQSAPEGIRFDFDVGSRIMPSERPVGGWRVRLHDLSKRNRPFPSENQRTIVSSAKGYHARFGIAVRHIDVSGETTPDETGYRPRAEHLRAPRLAEFVVMITAEQVIATIRRVPAFADAPERSGPDPVLHS
jgi:hypothetical protein